MPRASRNIIVGERELQIVVDRLSAVYGASPRRGHGNASERRLGAAWCIGETLAACGGYDLMWMVYQMIEERCGPPAPLGWIKPGTASRYPALSSGLPIRQPDIAVPPTIISALSTAGMRAVKLMMTPEPELTPAQQNKLKYKPAENL